MKVWTEAYRPFIMGGDANAPVCCDLEPASPLLDLGKGYQGVLVVSPVGKTFIAETITGGIVGKYIDEVRADVESADEEVMKTQIQAGKLRSEVAVPVTQQEFWRLLRADSL